MDEELIAYIRKLKGKGSNNEEIEKNLVKIGWNENTVQKALVIANNPDIPLPSNNQSKVQTDYGSHMWETFETIFMFLSLYVLALFTSILLNVLIDIVFNSAVVYGTSTSYSQSLTVPSLMPPNDVVEPMGMPIRPTYYPSTYQTTMIWTSISAILISFPLFIYFFTHINKSILENPQIKMLRSRRYFVYFTLTVCFFTLLGTGISFLSGIFNGYLNVNVFLHVLVTALISGSIFAYFLNEIKEHKRNYV